MDKLVYSQYPTFHSTHSWTSDQRENDLLCWQFHQWTQVCSCDGPFAVAYSFSLTYKHNLYPLSSQRCVNSPQRSPPLLIRHGTTVMPLSFCVAEIISSTAVEAFCSNQQPLLHSLRWEDTSGYPQRTATTASWANTTGQSWTRGLE